MAQLTDRIAAIDIGNSRIKILYRNRYSAYSLNEKWEEQIKAIFSGKKTGLTAAGVSSVNTKAYLILQNILAELGISEAGMPELIKSQSIIDFNKIQGIGIDRVLGLIGAVETSKAPLITVDCGTAVTINYLDKDYLCSGGVIFPGPQTQLKSLEEHTEALQETVLKFSENILAKDTESAISNGIIYGIAASIKGMTEQIWEENPEKNDCPIFITGGGATLLMPAMDKFKITYSYIEDLVLKGIYKLLSDGKSF